MAKSLVKPPPPPPPEGSVITALTPSPTSPNLVSVKIGRKTYAKIRVDDAASLDLHVGQPVTPDLISKLDAAAVKARARQYAINAVGSRAMSARTLKTKLKRKGVSEDTASTIAEDLSKKGILDEAAYARAVTTGQLQRSPAGRTLLIQKLRQRGVTDVNAKAAVDRVLEESDYDPKAAALKLAQKKLKLLSRVKDPVVVKRRLYGQLARRGFDADTCQWAMRQVLKGTDE